MDDLIGRGAGGRLGEVLFSIFVYIAVKHEALCCFERR